MHDFRHQYRNSAKTKDNQRQPKTTKDNNQTKKRSCLLCGTLNVQRLHQTLAWPEPFIPKNKHILTAGEGNREIASLPVAILHPSIEGECPECLPDS